MSECNQIFLMQILLYWFEAFQLNEVVYCDLHSLNQSTYLALLEPYFLHNGDGHALKEAKYFQLEMFLIQQ